jgi:hypothetical protein
MKYNKKLKGQVRYCFLFNDLLIYTQKKGTRYQFKGEIPLNGSLVSDINAKGEAGTKLASAGKDVNVGFQITHLEAKVSLLASSSVRSSSFFVLTTFVLSCDGSVSITSSPARRRRRKIGCSGLKFSPSRPSRPRRSGERHLPM